MIRWMCSVTTKDQVSWQDLLEKMQLHDLAKILLTHRLRWHDDVEYSNGWLKKVQKFNPTGGRGRGRPKKNLNRSHRHGPPSAGSSKPSLLTRMLECCYLESWCGHDGVLDDMILLFFIPVWFQMYISII